MGKITFKKEYTIKILNYIGIISDMCSYFRVDILIVVEKRAVSSLQESSANPQISGQVMLSRAKFYQNQANCSRIAFIYLFR